MGKPFQRVHASIVGKFEDGYGEKIPQWIRANGGQFSRDVDQRVTHLIATKDAFKNNAVPVQNAKKIGTIKIVSYDWLEDSLLSPTRRPKLEGPYLLKNLMKPEKKEVQKKVTKSSKVVKETKAKTPKRRIVDPFVGLKGKKKPVRQVYQDRKTNVVYSITLFRPSKPPATSREKYQLTLFESIAEPHTYSTYAKFSRVGTSNVELLTGPKVKLELAVDKFKQFFKQHTGKEWDERASGKMPPTKTDSDGNILPVHEGWFYLEEKTTILGAFLREPQSTGFQGSTDRAASDKIKEDGIEDKMADHQVEDGGEG
ncbi:uncharacterized protein N7479_008880 [Penicillium vulpinum]|uniref:Uncharacterized protein n=1 Tax=Penicillium vulpinum TaxID=29845 RepID=A0A1V6S0Z7_9EURO|nr:uncharacterized protein N7479_008880 [Penicillium vulpinum]KAJ5950467.1 hypothetical protein N7479_008880 [Penicillium vulpinum]OQE07695.1 hypothetical protein PENVUL_c012G02752 [Penicillium vulpinum]